MTPEEILARLERKPTPPPPDSLGTQLRVLLNVYPVACRNTLLVLLLTVSYLIGFYPITERILSETNRVHQLRSRLEYMAALETHESWIRQVEELRPPWRSGQELFEHFLTIARKHGVALSLLIPTEQAEPWVSGCSHVSIQVKVEGAFAGILGFLEEIERGDPFYRIGELALTKPSELVVANLAIEGLQRQPDPREKA